MISEFCIRRPVATLLMSFALILGGIFAYKFLPVAALPQAEFPVINVSASANVLAPARVADSANDRLALVTAEGRLLVFPLAELPELAKGKGNKLVALKGEDRILASCVLPADASLTLVCGKRTLSLKPADLANYSGSRASRGSHLPRGFQRVDSIHAET